MRRQHALDAVEGAAHHGEVVGRDAGGGQLAAGVAQQIGVVGRLAVETVPSRKAAQDRRQRWEEGGVGIARGEVDGVGGHGGLGQRERGPAGDPRAVAPVTGDHPALDEAPVRGSDGRRAHPACGRQGADGREGVTRPQRPAGTVGWRAYQREPSL